MLSSDNEYFLKKGYKNNQDPSYYNDFNKELVYQPDAYRLAGYLAERSNSKYIIDIGGGSGEKLKEFEKKYKIIIVDYGDNLITAKKNIPTAELINCNLEKELPTFDTETLLNSVVICSDVIEHLIKPEVLLTGLSDINRFCKFLILTTPDRMRARGIGDFGPPLNKCHVREWDIEEFHQLLRNYKFGEFFIGHTINTNVHRWKNTIITISGRYTNIKKENKLKVLAIINMYNELDIIEEVIQHLLLQGCEVKVIDNYSNDGSYELVKEITNKDKRVTLEQFPEVPNDYYEWIELLNNTIAVSNRVSKEYDWIIHHDADEFRYSPWRNVSLVEAIGFVDQLGYNAIDFTVLDFRPIIGENGVTSNYENNIRYFEFGRRNGHFVQIKAWKHSNEVIMDLSSTGGHEINFDGKRVFPIKFLMKHYPLRNIHQAQNKVYRDRLPRYSNYERKIGWHTQYNEYAEKDKNVQFKWNKNHLLLWNPYFFESEYLIERISGIGVLD